MYSLTKKSGGSSMKTTNKPQLQSFAPSLFVLQLCVLCVAAIMVTLLPIQHVAGLNNGAALTPPMGFSTWNAIRCNFNDKALLDVADAMVKTGMVAAGYVRLDIDDCWPLKKRNATTGDIVPDPERFPEGMSAFSRALSSRGLKLGIYTAHGNLTCQKYPGSWGHEAQDARLYAEWEVDFVKNDWCWHKEDDPKPHLAAFARMRDELAIQANRTGRPVIYSIHYNTQDSNPPRPDCTRGAFNCPLPDYANMWRVGGDIRPNWASILRLIDLSMSRVSAAGPGAFNDADMLEVGNGMTTDQDRGHFGMWCIMASPLVSGNDPRKQSAVTTSILTNRHAIAINQDPLAIQAHIVVAINTTDINAQVFAKPLANGGVAVAFLNRVGPARTIGVDFKVLGSSSSSSRSSSSSSGAAATAFNVFDVWAGKSLGVKTNSFSAIVPATSAGLYIFNRTTTLV